MIRADKSEMLRASEYLNGLFSDMTNLPFSFRIGDTQYHGFDKDFALHMSPSPDADNVSEIRAVHSSGLEFSVIIKKYPDHSAFEWTLYITNKSNTDSPVISSLLSADMDFCGDNPSLTHFIGDDYADPFAYSPMSTVLRPYTNISFEPEGGRPTNMQFPYYYINYGNGGAIISVGWSGQWKSSFSAYRGKVHFTAGQGEFSAYLKPNETVRTPMTTLLVYYGRDESRTINLWRRFFIDCNMRKINGDGSGEKLFSPYVSAATSWLYNEMRDATGENQIQAFEAYRTHGIDLDFWWMDAGWYYKGIEKNEPISSWTETGSWIVDTERFPGKLSEVSEHVEKYGAKTLLWFEPERVTENTFLSTKKEWLLGSHLADLGNDEFRSWLTDRVDTVLGEGKISLYRQDFNIDPLPFWRIGDSSLRGDSQKGENRIGITENMYVQGYLKYWDEIISRHPDMMIDSCASGGRRNDLETMRRSVPLHKTDADYSNFTQKHAMHHMLYRWFPYFGAPTNGPGYIGVDEYSIRTAQVPWMGLSYDIRPSVLSDDEYSMIKKYIDEWRDINRYFYGDYYPVTDYCYDSSAWIGWEFWLGDEGIIQLFRQETSADAEFTVYPKGLTADNKYVVSDVDFGVIFTGRGDEIMQSGIKVLRENPRSAVILKITQL